MGGDYTMPGGGGKSKRQKVADCSSFNCAKWERGGKRLLHFGLVLRLAGCNIGNVRTKYKKGQSAVVRLNPAAVQVVVGWSELTNWSAAKVASELILWASGQKGASVNERLKRESDACAVVRSAMGKAAWIRAGKAVPCAR